VTSGSLTRGHRVAIGIWVTLPLIWPLAGCASGGTSPFDKTYGAVVYGRVTRGGSGPDGLNRILLTGTNSHARQCLVLAAQEAPPPLHTLDQTPFTAEFPGPPTDSVQIDAGVP
jgi:hypothetical protein